MHCVYDLGTKGRSWFLSLFIQPQPIDSQLRGCIGDFLRTVQDPDLICSTCSFCFSTGPKPFFFTLQCGESAEWRIFFESSLFCLFYSECPLCRFSYIQLSGSQ